MYFRALCEKLAKLRNITDYQSISGTKKCFQKDVSLFSTKKINDEVVPEDLLFCKYNREPLTLHDKYYEIPYEVDQSELGILGRGKNENDVIEYILFKANLYMPYENLTDFLKEDKTL